MSRSEEILNAVAHPLTPLRPTGGGRAAYNSLSLEESRSGEQTLSVHTPKGNRYLHSRYGPRREAQRLAEQQEGFLVILGLGLGYLAAQSSQVEGVAGVLAVEPSEAVVSLLREHGALEHLAGLGEMLRLLLLPRPDVLEEAVAAFYLPALHERISLYVTPGYEQLIDPAPYRAAFERGVARATGNHHTMARFGKSWTTNIVANLRTLIAPTAGNVEAGLAGKPTRPLDDATIIGAGPTLEDWLGRTAVPSHSGENLHAGSQLRLQGALLAADTALPRLMRAGIEPDLVLTIDANPATYHHFLSGPTFRPTLLADLTAPPMIRRYAAKIAYFSGGHPLANFLVEEEEILTGLSTEGGNVGFTLLSAAAALGARRIAVVGLDYAYIRGRAYARGTYLDDYFFSQADRVSPVVGRWTTLLFRDPDARQISGGEPWSYRDPKLERYAAAFEKFAGDLEDNRVELLRQPTTADRPLSGGSQGVREEILPRIEKPQNVSLALRRLKKALQTPISPRGRPLWALSRAERALLPLAAWYERHPGRRSVPPLEAARVFTLDALGKAES